MTMTTANRVSDQQSGGPTPEQVRRGRRTAILLFAIGFGPMVFATIMYYTGWLNPTGHTNNGELVKPVVPVTELHMQTSDDKPLAEWFGPERADAEWMMMVVAGNCAEDCENLLYLARQVNIALGKNANRMSRAAFIGTVPAELERRWAEEYSAMERLQSQGDRAPAWPAGVRPDQEPRILLLDPFGNVMMHYGNEHSGKDMLKDLKHLMKLSQIG